MVTHPQRRKLVAVNPRIHFRISELSIVGNFIIVPFPAGLGSVLRPPSYNPNQSSERGKNGLPHCYFLENFERKSTIFWSVFSGSSPGINEATAITAVKRAVAAPTQATQSCVVTNEMRSFISEEGVSRV